MGGSSAFWRFPGQVDELGDLVAELIFCCSWIQVVVIGSEWDVGISPVSVYQIKIFFLLGILGKSCTAAARAIELLGSC